MSRSDATSKRGTYVSQLQPTEPGASESTGIGHFHTPSSHGKQDWHGRQKSVKGGGRNGGGSDGNYVHK